MNIIKFITLITLITLITPKGKLFAVSPTITPIASPSAALAPTGTDDDKVQEIRQAIKDKLNQIKEKVEKKAYVGVIAEITDSTLTLSNFRGKQRVRIAEDTAVIDANKKTISLKDMAVDDKVIAMGEIDPNETLNAKRVIIVPKPKVAPVKKLSQYGLISVIDSKTSSITIIGNKGIEITLKIDTKTTLIKYNDTKTQLKLKDIKPDQKVIAVYPETTEGKTPVAIDIFVLQ